MNKLSVIAAVGILCVSGVACAGGPIASVPCPGFAKTGPELGIQGGYGFIGTPERNLFNRADWVLAPSSFYVEKFTFNENHSIGDWVWGAYGAYNFKISANKTVGVQLGYKDFSKSTYNSIYADNYIIAAQPPVFKGFTWTYTNNTSVSIKQQAVDLLLTAHYWVWDGLNVFGKAGAAYVNSKITQDQHASIVENPLIDQDANTFFNDFYSQDIWRLRPEVELGIGFTFNQYLDLSLSYNHLFSDGNNTANFKLDDTFLGSNNPLAPRIPAFIYSVDTVMVGLSVRF